MDDKNNKILQHASVCECCPHALKELENPGSGNGKSRRLYKEYCPFLGNFNIITSLTTKERFFRNSYSLLSVKSSLKGEETYEINDGRALVNENKYMIVNQGQNYESLIESDNEVESYCISFGEEFARDVMNSMILPDELLLEGSIPHSTQPIIFFEKTYNRSPEVTQLLHEIYDVFSDGITPAILEEKLHQLMEMLIQNHRALNAEIDKIPARKLSVKTELFRRLSIAKDYMDTCYNRNLSLSELASTACLSRHHFLRLFRGTFGITPVKYLMNIRLEKSRQLLGKSDMSITEIALETGFENPGHFSKAFKSYYGISPKQAR